MDALARSTDAVREIVSWADRWIVHRCTSMGPKTKRGLFAVPTKQKPTEPHSRHGLSTFAGLNHLSCPWPAPAFGKSNHPSLPHRRDSTTTSSVPARPCRPLSSHCPILGYVWPWRTVGLLCPTGKRVPVSASVTHRLVSDLKKTIPRGCRLSTLSIQDRTQRA